MVTCGGSQHWARRLQELGHEVSFGYQRRRGSGKWRGGTDRGVRDLRHQEPAGPYRAHPRTDEAVSISASVSPSLKAEKALRDAVNAGRRSWPWAGRRFRPGTPRIHPIWKPADYDTMTDPPGFTALLPGNPNVTDGLRAWLLPSWIRDCICGKDITFHHCQRYAVATCKMKGNPLIMRRGVLVLFLGWEIVRWQLFDGWIGY